MMEPQASQGLLRAEGDCGMSNLLVPSPQSEAVTHEMEELSLQPTQSLPPLSERKNVLQLRLQQRRTREQLVDQGIMPPLKSPAAFHGQIRSLERARTENFLKHKIRSRPERAELVRMHILQETGAEPSLQATQMRLKRARLADNLNEKIAQRPGPMELVEKNILPVDSSLKEAIIGQVTYPKVLDEDSNDALSPEQPASQESQSSAPSPGENRVPETPSPGPASAPLPSPVLQALPTIDFTRATFTTELPASRPAAPPAQPATPAAPHKPGPTLVKQSQQKTPSEKSRSKKGKDAKSRVKKLKYHQYVPPDQKLEASEAPMDSSYARLLQQQQLFLQLQILSQQQQHYNYQTILPAPLNSNNNDLVALSRCRPMAEGQSNAGSTLPTSIMVSLPTAPPPPPPAPTRPNNSLSNRKPGVLPANLEEMKVAELKLELKLRGLPVSGTKTDLIERLKPFQDNPSATTPSAILAPATTTLSSIPMEVIAATAPALVLPVQQVATERMSSTPPVSPSPADPSTLQQDVGMSEAPAEIQIGSFGSTGIQLSPLSPFQVPAEKDRRLHEKEQQIEELMRKLAQEQRLVEELKMQLQVEKRGQGGCTADSYSASPSSLPAVNTFPSALNSNVVKMEGTVLSNCSSTTAALPNSILGSQGLTAPLPTVVKLEDVTVSSGKPLNLHSQTGLFTQIQPQVSSSPQLCSQSQKSPQIQVQAQPQPAAASLQQFFISHRGGVSQVLGQPQTLLTTTGQAGAQILLPVSLPNSAATIQLQPVLQATASNPGLVQASAPQLQSSQMEMAPSHQSLLQTLSMCNNTTGLENQTRPELNPQCFLRCSPESRVSPRASPNHQISNGPLSKPAFVLQPTSLVAQPPKTKEPPRYEDAVKQSRNLHINNASQVPTATSQHMDDLFDILIESGEITPFIQQDPPASMTKTLPVTASITTLPVNTALSRPPPQIQVGPPPTMSSLMIPSLPSLSSLATDNQLEAFLERTLADTPPASDPRTQGLMEELQAQLMDQQPYSPMDTSDLSFCDSSSPPSSLNMGLSDPALDNMEWLDLTMPPGPAGALTPLGIPTDFLDTHDLQLHWD
ncbi:myocardin-related transcription factor B isoform 2-T4 [Odontesthes bonariensis]|uniref:myocardin-related transcription factor B isoform X2 n=1 Tax=Odontesthes bonariensis TaxID=219752 RepID=UPI003F58B230